VNSTNVDIPIEGMLADFNYDQVKAVASQADVCLVFVNADSGEGLSLGHPLPNTA